MPRRLDRPDDLTAPSFVVPQGGVATVVDAGLGAAEAVVQRISTSADAIAAAGAEARYAQALPEAEEATKGAAGPGGAGFGAALKKERDALRDDILKGLPDYVSPAARQRVERALAEQDEISNERVLEWIEEQETEWRQGQVDAVSDHVAALAEADASPASIAAARADLLASLAAADLPEWRARMTLQAFDARVEAARHEALIAAGALEEAAETAPDPAAFTAALMSAPTEDAAPAVSGEALIAEGVEAAVAAWADEAGADEAEADEERLRHAVAPPAEPALFEQALTDGFTEAERAAVAGDVAAGRLNAEDAAHAFRLAELATAPGFLEADAPLRRLPPDERAAARAKLAAWWSEGTPDGARAKIYADGLVADVLEARRRELPAVRQPVHDAADAESRAGLVAARLVSMLAGDPVSDLIELAALSAWTAAAREGLFDE